MLVALHHAVAFPEGCVLNLHVAARRGSEDELAWKGLIQGHFRRDPELTGIDADLKFGVRFPDGSRATTYEHAFRDWAHPTDRPEPPMLIEAGGTSSGGDQSYHSHRRLWLWPLPPAESFEFVIEWHSMGIDQTSIQLNGSAIVRAANRPCRTGRNGRPPSRLAVTGSGWFLSVAHQAPAPMLMIASFSAHIRRTEAAPPTSPAIAQAPERGSSARTGGVGSGGRKGLPTHSGALDACCPPLDPRARRAARRPRRPPGTASRRTRPPPPAACPRRRSRCSSPPRPAWRCGRSCCAARAS